MCISSLLMLSSYMLIIFLKAHCLRSSSVFVFGTLADVIIATFGSVQRQFCEEPTSPPPVVVEGILASAVLLDDSLGNT